MQINVIQNVAKTIGSLALVYPYLRRLGVYDTADDMTTVGKDREVPTARVMSDLVLSRLSLRLTPISSWGTEPVIRPPSARGLQFP